MSAFARVFVAIGFVSLLTRVSAVPPIGPFGPGNNWKLQGCYTDQAGRSRTLGAASYVDDQDMTVESCVSFCKNGGFSYAGVEYGKECYCDYALQSGGDKVSSSECNMPCSGDSSEICGAGNRLNIYSNNDVKPKNPNRVGTWKYTGCFVDVVGDRKLERPLSIPGGTTVESCTTACKAAGFRYAGMEYSSECWCGNSLVATKAPDSDCSMTCAGDHSEFCGGPDRLTVYRDFEGFGR